MRIRLRSIAAHLALTTLALPLLHCTASAPDSAQPTEPLDAAATARADAEITSAATTLEEMGFRVDFDHAHYADARASAEAAEVHLLEVPFAREGAAEIGGYIAARRDGVNENETLVIPTDDVARAAIFAPTTVSEVQAEAEASSAADVNASTPEEITPVCTPLGGTCGGRFVCCTKNEKCQLSPRYRANRCRRPLWGVQYATNKTRVSATCLALGMIGVQTFIRNRTGFQQDGIAMEALWDGSGVNFPWYPRTNHDLWACGLAVKWSRNGLPLCSHFADC